MDHTLALLSTVLFAASSWQVLLPLPARRLRALVRRALAMFREWRLRSRSRRELAEFGERELRDIGLSSTQAAFERGKTFLQA